MPKRLATPKRSTCERLAMPKRLPTRKRLATPRRPTSERLAFPKRQPAMLRPSCPHPAGGDCRCQGRQRERLHQPPAQRVPDKCGRARPEPERRAEAAHRNRARNPQEPASHAAGRCVRHRSRASCRVCLTRHVFGVLWAASP
eukprot:353939-Chlamydomonas_euryale.AAC.36